MPTLMDMWYLRMPSFLSMALHHLQPWTEIFTVTARIVLYFVMPLAWVTTQSRRTATWLPYFMLMLPWLIKCTTESIPSIDIYCNLSAMMSILPTYLFVLQRIFCRTRFSTCREKICSCLLVVCGILLASLYAMEKQQVHAIQQSAPFVGVWKAFGLDVAKRVVRDGTYTCTQKPSTYSLRWLSSPYKPSVPNSYSVTTKDDIHMKMFTDILQQSVKSSFWCIIMALSYTALGVMKHGCPSTEAAFGTFSSTGAGATLSTAPLTQAICTTKN